MHRIFFVRMNKTKNTDMVGRSLFMRIFIILTGAIACISLLYKWRYKLLNAILAVSFLRRIAVSFSMNLPSIRKKILPSIFSDSTT